MHKDEIKLLGILKKRVSAKETLQAIMEYYRSQYGSKYLIHVADAGVISVMKMLLAAPKGKSAPPIYTKLIKELSLKGLTSHFSLCAVKAATKVVRLESSDVKKDFAKHFVQELIEDIFLRNLPYLIGHIGVVNLNSMEVRLAGVQGYLWEQFTDMELDSIIESIVAYHEGRELKKGA